MPTMPRGGEGGGEDALSRFRAMRRLLTATATAAAALLAEVLT
jgi:hypothetical protein